MIHKTIGAPINDVTAFIGKTDSENIILLNREQTEQSKAPPKIQPGIRYR
jgi:hypothetical protein